MKKTLMAVALALALTSAHSVEMTTERVEIDRQDTTIIQNKTVIVNPTQNQPAATPQVQAQKTFRPSISPTSTQPKVQAPTQTFRPSVAAAPKVSAPAPASRTSVSSSKPATSSFRPSVKR